MANIAEKPENKTVTEILRSLTQSVSNLERAVKKSTGTTDSAGNAKAANAK